MPTVYFAGPDLFGKDYNRVKEEIRRLCAEQGIDPLIPGDGPESSLGGPGQDQLARAIYLECLGHIEAADGVIANLAPFRGPIEPDSGTSFEVGYAAALGKWVIGYLPDTRPLPERVLSSPLGGGGDGGKDSNGDTVEDWGYPLNLMLAKACGRIVGSLEEAVLCAGALGKGG
jgi:nucleoside 2-deoxyribosyltransferase